MFKKIRTEGLDYKVTSVKILPTTESLATIQVEYEVSWNPEFRKMIIEFLKKLEKDTGGGFDNYDERQDAYIQWAPTGWSDSRVYIKTNEADFNRLIKQYNYAPTTVGIPALNYCDKFNAVDGIFYFQSINKTAIIKTSQKELSRVKGVILNNSCTDKFN